MDFEVMTSQIPGIALDEQSEEKHIPRRLLSCDQVSTLIHALERLQGGHPDLHGRWEKAAVLATLLDIMGLLGYEFEDKAAAGNALYGFWEFNQMRKGE
jgi:hypothetical protein